MLTLHLILAILPCFISVTLANSGCNDAMLALRIAQTDFPALWDLERVSYNNSLPQPDYEIVRHCRAHSFMNPMWLSNTIIALTFSVMNSTYYTVLHYDSCNDVTSEFDDPTILVNITKSNGAVDLKYRTNNMDADFCHNCINDTSVNYCESCDPACRRIDDNELEFCYGASNMSCCRYIQDDTCVDECNPGSVADSTSMCLMQEHVCTRDNPCEEGTCEEVSVTEYRCDCSDTHVGVNCSIENPCSTMDTCNDYEVCNTMESDPYYECVCITGVFGDSCQYNQYCNDSVNPCVNGGSCTATDADDVTCNCTTGLEGDICQYNKYCNETVNPCQNSGTCDVTNAENYTCDCPTGFEGDICQYNQNCTATDNPCYATGNCTVMGANNFTCDCVTGVEGDRCQYNENCNKTVNPCQNNGMCIAANAENYTCECLPGFEGYLCEYNMNCTATDNPCNAAGTCIAMGTNNFMCDCVTGVTGNRCQISAKCNGTDHPCLNDGTCNVQDADTFTCTCANGYSGDTCEIAPSTGEASAPVGVIAGVVVVIIIIAIVIVVIVILCVLFFYLKGKKGKVEISKKTSKVYPANGDNTVAEKEPMLDTEKQ